MTEVSKSSSACYKVDKKSYDENYDRIFKKKLILAKIWKITKKQLNGRKK
jgi:hypothetical protein